MALLEIVLALGVHGLPRSARIAQWVAAAIFLIITLMLRRLSIRVTNESITWGFGPFRKRVIRSQITSVRIVEASMARTGIGVHRVGGGLWAWVARTGPAIEILVSGERVPGYIISTSRPRDLKVVLVDGDQLLRTAGSGRTVS